MENLIEKLKKQIRKSGHDNNVSWLDLDAKTTVFLSGEISFQHTGENYYCIEIYTKTPERETHYLHLHYSSLKVKIYCNEHKEIEGFTIFTY